MDSNNFLDGTFDPFIGHEIIEIKENYVKSSLEVKDFHKQPMGMVHGGVIDTMAEAAISYAAYFTQEGTWVGATIGDSSGGGDRIVPDGGFWVWRGME